MEQTLSAPPAADADAEADAASPPAYVLASPSAPRLWGLSPDERLQRALPRLGVDRVRHAGTDPWPESGRVLVLRSDVAYDDPVLAGLAAWPDVLLARASDGAWRPLAAHVGVDHAAAARAWLDGRGAPPQGYRIVGPEQVGQAYRSRLRKREAPYCLDLVETGRRAAERRIYMGAYKGVTDFVTKYVWPVPAMWATRACVRAGLSPNAVTTASLGLVMLALWLFWTGAFGWGLLAAWAMTFLDTVDGKLARVTLTSSRFGNILDHGIDIVHPPFWYLAWAYGLQTAGAPLPQDWFGPVVAAIFAGYILGRLAEGTFTRRFGLELFVWTRFDSRFRELTARRNPCLVLLTLFWALGRPDWGLLAVAGWTVASTLVLLGRLLQAERARRLGHPVASWMRTEP